MRNQGLFYLLTAIMVMGTSTPAHSCEESVRATFALQGLYSKEPQKRVEAIRGMKDLSPEFLIGLLPHYYQRRLLIWTGFVRRGEIDPALDRATHLVETYLDSLEKTASEAYLYAEFVEARERYQDQFLLDIESFSLMYPLLFEGGIPKSLLQLDASEKGRTVSATDSILGVVGRRNLPIGLYAEIRAIKPLMEELTDIHDEAVLNSLHRDIAEEFRAPLFKMARLWELYLKKGNVPSLAGYRLTFEILSNKMKRFRHDMLRAYLKQKDSHNDGEAAAALEQNLDRLDVLASQERERLAAELRAAVRTNDRTEVFDLLSLHSIDVTQGRWLDLTGDEEIQALLRSYGAPQ